MLPPTLTLGWVVRGKQRRIRVLPTPEGLPQAKGAPVIRYKLVYSAGDSEHGLWDQATWLRSPALAVCDPEQFTLPVCASVSLSIKWEQNSTCFWLFGGVSKQETMLSYTRELMAGAQPPPWGVAHLWDKFVSDSNTGRGTREVPHKW